MTKNEALEIIVSLGKPGKMPCKSYSISPLDCKTGGKLRSVENSVCSKCYALKGNYCFDVVKTAHKKRKESLKNPQWVDAMVKVIGNDTFFRWHDSGDLQSLAHLKKIVKICELTPHCKHWLPTKEKTILKSFLRSGGIIPENLVIRLSAYIIDSGAPKAPNGVLTSTVHSKGAPFVGIECKAYKQGGNCQECRACWDKTVSNVSYRKH